MKVVFNLLLALPLRTRVPPDTEPTYDIYFLFLDSNIEFTAVELTFHDPVASAFPTIAPSTKQDIPEYELALPVNNMCIREGRETLFIPSRINMLLTSKSAQGLSIGP